MKLAQKGSFAPPPRLPHAAQALSELLACWPRVHARTHWRLGDERFVDGADFYRGDLSARTVHTGEDELGHLHLDGEAHVAVGEKLADALVRAGLASRFRWSPAFVTHPIASEADVKHGAWLFQLRYDALEGAAEPELLDRVAGLRRAS